MFAPKWRLPVVQAGFSHTGVSGFPLTYLNLAFPPLVAQTGEMRLFQTELRSRALWSSALYPVLALLLAASASAETDNVLPDCIPAGTKILFGIRMRNIVELLQSQNSTTEWRTTTSALLAQTPLAGFDPLKDIDEVIIASTGVGDNPPVLAVLRGRFDVDRLGQRATSYHGVPILEDAKKSSGMALLDGSTAIVGELPVVRAAIDQRGNGVGIAAGLAARVEPLRSRYSIWGIGDLPKQPHVAAGPATEPGATDSIDRFEFGAEIGHGLELTADIHVRTAQDAEKMASSLGFLEGMLKDPKVSASGTKFELRTDKGLLHVAIMVPEEEWNKAIRERTGDLKMAMASRLPAEIASQFSHDVVIGAPKTTGPSGGKVVRNSQGDAQVVTLPGRR